jgi:hypothetical protein
MVQESVSLFISYSHKDETMRLELESFLKPLMRDNVKTGEKRLIRTFHDRKIPAGAAWDKEIEVQLRSADIIVMLMSQDFLASDYISEQEVPDALHRHDRGEAKVIPVILRTFDWNSSPVSHLQSVPRDKRAVSAWSDRDAAYVEVIQAIREAAKELIQSRLALAQKRADAAQQYRQKVDETLSDGVITVGERDTLDELWKRLELSPEDAAAIEVEAHKPIQAYAEKLEQYKMTLLKHIALGYPLSDDQRKDLDWRQRDLGLKDHDALATEQPILAQAQKDHEAGLLARAAEKAKQESVSRQKAREGADAQLAKAAATDLRREYAVAGEYVKLARLADPTHPALQGWDAQIQEAIRSAEKESKEAARHKAEKRAALAAAEATKKEAVAPIAKAPPPARVEVKLVKSEKLERAFAIDFSGTKCVLTYKNNTRWLGTDSVVFLDGKEIGRSGLLTDEIPMKLTLTVKGVTHTVTIQEKLDDAVFSPTIIQFRLTIDGQTYYSEGHPQA